MRYVLLSAGALATCAVTALVVPGCSDRGPEAGSESQPTPAAAATAKVDEGSGAAKLAQRQVGGFIGTYDRKTHTFSITPKVAPTTLSNHITPDSVDPVTTDQTGGVGIHPSNTVDLVSTACSDVPGTSFQCTVELRSYYSRTLINPTVQITAIYGADGGSAASGHSATNSDSTNKLGLSNTYGLWTYTNADQSANAVEGVLVPNSVSSTDATGSRVWQFANSDDAAVSYDIQVYASLNFASYTVGKANADTTGNADATGGYFNACANGTFFDTAAKTAITIPFDFTLYDKNVTTISVDQVGSISFGSSSEETSDTSLDLPSTTVASTVGNVPVFFPFWDGLKGDSNDASADEGLLCGVTLGSAPNRKYIIEWQNFDFTASPKLNGNADGANKGASLDFEVWLYEGTSEIDVVYETMQGPTSGAGKGDGRETGLLATIGMQNSAGTAATVQYHTAAVATCARGSGSAPCTTVGYIPVP